MNKFAALKSHINKVELELDKNWDCDDSMNVDRATEIAYGRLLFAMHEQDPGALDWLVFYVARRALNCWELSCDEARPRRLIEDISAYLSAGSSVDWQEAIRATPSPFNDCRYSDTQSASDAVAECARYISKRIPIHSVYCVSAADVAYDHVLTDHQFRRWFLHVAVPIACEKRDMTPVEREAYRPSG